MEIFEAITWKQYLIIIAVGLVLYYVVIMLKYNKGLTRKLQQKRNRKMDHQEEDAYGDDNEPEELQEFQQQQQHIHSFDELEALVTEIRHSILEKAGTAVSKEDLLQQISNRLTDYGGLRQPAYRIALTNFIIEQSENICGVAFSEEELEEAWAKLPR